MSHQTDLDITLDRAAGLTLDATCACRSACADRLPDSHRRLVNSAIRRLENAQLDLFYARNDPWSHQTPRPHRQLQLL